MAGLELPRQVASLILPFKYFLSILRCNMLPNGAGRPAGKCAWNILTTMVWLFASATRQIKFFARADALTAVIAAPVTTRFAART
jgi:hypothetical protein